MFLALLQLTFSLLISYKSFSEILAELKCFQVQNGPLEINAFWQMFVKWNTTFQLFDADG